jgi:WhiB family redox-sensing transcriptional regulator
MVAEGSRPAPAYPPYTGEEPCAEIGIDLYYLPEDTPHSKMEARVTAMACGRCPLLDACLEWALHRERWGYWAGTTADQRRHMRRNLGITVVEPQYEQWMPKREARDDAA